MLRLRFRLTVALLAMLGVVAVAGFAALLVTPALRAADWGTAPRLADDGPAMPDFTRRSADAWLNTHPLTAAEVRGCTTAVAESSDPWSLTGGRGGGGSGACTFPMASGCGVRTVVAVGSMDCFASV